ncbi:bifunctional metallophosphatase/5'-nucleotidase [Nocardioides xinjiangensis]|uniref:bifunctional metallophosphatase/5'-nucleotidase n=1 Tax=Nocardioides xinjiangensis TaxID=2817376 RepID=UPI001B30B71D|nr:bifunctional UDP-sugar hydrolase/5'-nucleotidase [Nocardioides sp. SYSU D00778]
MPASRTGRKLALATTLTGLLAAPLAVVATAAPATAAAVPVTILNFNDFHGRIDNNTTRWATTIEQNRDASTMVLSAGDNIGASLFASAFNDDKPTIDVLNALDLDVSVVGNHEFDKGWPWFKSHVVDGGGTAPDGTAYPQASFPYLGANVLDAAGNPVLPASTQITLGGANVCVIGAVTQETPSLVSPGGIAGLRFTDPVAAVNQEVARLQSAGVDCDATVANYHEGGPQSQAAATQAQQEAASAVFRHLTQDTVAAVDVIYNGHSHQPYAYNGSRPVVQTEAYGASLGKVSMTIDTDTNTVSAVTATLVPRATAADLARPRVAAVDAIVKAALAAANVVGDRAVGRISADITRADSDPVAPGVQEDRKAESTIGNLVADALRDVKIPAVAKTPTIGITNPGGLRADLLYKGDLSTSPENTDGVVTFEEANAVLPFVNNVSYVDVTGATLKKIFEQQWQPSTASNPFLHLGVSRNVQTILDASRPVGDRVVSITVDGQLVDPAKTYTVSTFSFLAQGGDNFGAFKEGKAIDTGAVDRDLWIDSFFRNGQVKSPSPVKRQIYASGLKNSYVAGEKAKISFEKLDITSLGIPANTKLELVKVRRDGSSKVFGTTAVVGGKSTVSFTVRAGKELRIIAQPSGTTIARAVVKGQPRMSVRAFPRAGKAKVGKTQVRLRIKVKAAHVADVDGWVKVRVAGKTYRTKVEDGVAKVKLRAFKKARTYNAKVTFNGTNALERVRKVVEIKVRRRR